jgi:uncharacterized protein (TIRG00374 family)
MKKKLLTLLQYVFFAALAAFFVWLSLRGLDKKGWTQLEDALRRANYWLLIPVLLLLLLSHYLRALRWRQLMEPLGYNPSIANTFFGVMIGYFVNLGAPRLGEVIKCTILARYEKVPADKLVGTIVAERAFDVICLALVFGLTFIFQFDVIQQTLQSGKIDLPFMSGNRHSTWLKIVVLVAVFGILFFTALYIRRRFGHINIVRKIENVVVNIWHGLISVKSLKNLPLFFFYTIAIWSLYLLSTYVGFFAIAETRHLTITDALSVLAIGSVAMIVSPGGIGMYPLLVEGTISLFNVPFPYGQALGWLLWFGQFVSFILFGVVSFILLPRVNRNKYEPATNYPS